MAAAPRSNGQKTAIIRNDVPWHGPGSCKPAESQMWSTQQAGRVCLTLPDSTTAAGGPRPRPRACDLPGPHSAHALGGLPRRQRGGRRQGMVMAVAVAVAVLVALLVPLADGNIIELVPTGTEPPHVYATPTIPFLLTSTVNCAPELAGAMLETTEGSRLTRFARRLDDVFAYDIEITVVDASLPQAVYVNMSEAMLTCESTPSPPLSAKAMFDPSAQSSDDSESLLGTVPMWAIIAAASATLCCGIFCACVFKAGSHRKHHIEPQEEEYMANSRSARVLEHSLIAQGSELGSYKNMSSHTLASVASPRFVSDSTGMMSSAAGRTMDSSSVVAPRSIVEQRRGDGRGRAETLPLETIHEPVGAAAAGVGPGRKPKRTDSQRAPPPLTKHNSMPHKLRKGRSGRGRDLHRSPSFVRRAAAAGGENSNSHSNSNSPRPRAEQVKSMSPRVTRSPTRMRAILALSQAELESELVHDSASPAVDKRSSRRDIHKLHRSYTRTIGALNSSAPAGHARTSSDA